MGITSGALGVARPPPDDQRICHSKKTMKSRNGHASVRAWVFSDGAPLGYRFVASGRRVPTKQNASTLGAHPLITVAHVVSRRSNTRGGCPGIRGSGVTD